MQWKDYDMRKNQPANRLINEKSPYLLQHAYNPVNWYPWGDEAFEEAKRRDVPIFLSSGYSSCHWCHVMEQESFEDETVADALNRDYVSIKLDREERPDVDHFYMEACMRMNASGGWPLSVFMNHDKTPFFIATYIPKEAKFGSKGLLTLLESIRQFWNHHREVLLNNGLQVVSTMEQDKDHKDTKIDGLPEMAYGHFEASFDQKYGGFGHAPKFPSVSNLLFLLRYGKLYPDSKASDMVNKTLESMEDGGIFDHIGGGFFRYSTDGRWLVPHFEKMTYDNAMLLMIYGESTVALDEKFKKTAERIADYVLSEMRGKEGGFFTAQDADTAEGEGSVYLWTPQEIVDVLGVEEGEKFSKIFNITQEGNFEGSNIPNRIGHKTLYDAESMQQCFDKLLQKRKSRIQPMTDDKIITSVNGLMIAALSSAGRHLNRPEWIVAAERAANFILEKLTINNRLMTSWRGGEAKHKGTLDDYAYFIWGLIELYVSTYSEKWLVHALSWSERMIELFGEDNGGLYLSGTDVSDIPMRQKSYSDGALPSGNGIAALNLFRLSSLLSRSDLNHYASDILNASYGQIRNMPTGYSALLIALLADENVAELVISAGEGQEKLISMLKGFTPFINPVIVGSENLTEIFAQKLVGKIKIQGRAAAYYCDKVGCRTPITDPEELAGILNL